MPEVVLAERNGHKNGNHNGSFSEGRTAALVEPLVDVPPGSRPSSNSASAAAESNATSGAQPSKEAAVEAKATQQKKKGVTGNPAKAKPAKKSKPSRPKIKYVPQADLDAEVARLETLSRAARNGNTAALDKLRHALDDCYPHVWRRLADFQILVERKLIALVAGIDPLRVEAFRKRCSELRRDLLEGASSSLATKMAASRVVTCWMFAQFLELRVLESPDQRWPMKDLELAERRYQTAMRTFGQARQLDLQLQRLAKQNSQEDGNGRN